MKYVCNSLFYLGLSITTLVTLKPVGKVKAQQIIEDNTVGTQVTRDVLIRNIESDRVDGGTISGGNLYHSFQEFNVEQGRGVYFSNPQGINNILTRVRGNNPSNILGTLGVLGNANLFLINPRGIEFGPNSRLDVGGSFFVSTADSLLFDNGFEFSASNNAAPPLLTVNTPIGLRFRDNPGNIGNQSTTDNVGLQIPTGETLALIGGNVNFDGGIITAPGGRVELGGLSVAGTVNINENSSFSFPQGIERTDVSLSNGASVNVRAGGGGFITVNADNVQLSESSFLLAGIDLDMGSPEARGGDIIVNSTGSVALNDGSQLSILVRGQGDGGKVIINAQDQVSFNGVGSNGRPSGAFSTVQKEGVGNADNIEINTSSLSLNNGAQLNASTGGEGNVGKIIINASDSVSFDGIESNGFSSGAFSNVDNGGIGNTAGIEITTGNLFLTNGAKLSNSSFGQGNVGSITIKASDSISFNNSEAFSSVENGGIGNAGGIEITTSNLSLSNGSIVSTNTFGQGNAGEIEITTSKFSVTNGAILTASTFGQGNAGKVTIKASDSISFDSIAAASRVGEDAVGNAGGIEIITGSLSLTNGSLAASTRGEGNAGTITIKANDSISFNGVGSNGTTSRILNLVGEKAIGNGGDINISVTDGSFSLSDGASLATSTFGQGNAGNIQINASDGISINSSQINSGTAPSAVGDAGDITLNTRSLSLLSNSSIATSVLEQGNAGNIQINATDDIFIDSSQLQSASFGGENAGDINFNTRSLSLSNSSIINSVQTGENAGNIQINATDNIFINNSQMLAASFTGGNNGGDISLNTASLSLFNSSIATLIREGQGNAGNIQIKTIDDISINNSSLGAGAFIGNNTDAGNIDITTSQGSILIEQGNINTISADARFAGDIIFNATNGSIILKNNSLINSTNNGTGLAGDIILNAADHIYVANNSRISASTLSQGNAGNIALRTENGNISLTDGSFVRSTVEEGIDSAGNLTIGQGDGGTVDIITKNLTLTNGSQIQTAVFSGQIGSAGDITINVSGDVSIKNGGAITASSAGTGEAGNIELKASNLTLDRGLIAAATGGTSGGNINLNIRDVLLLRRNSQISTTAGILEGTGDGGNIDINTGLLVALPKENSDITANAVNDSGGRVNIEADSILGIEPLSRTELQRLLNTTNPNELDPRRLPSSDITAISQGNPNLNGQVTITTPDVDPGDDLVELPENVTDPGEQIAQNPCKQGVGSEFIQVGRGGLPIAPNQTLSGSTVRIGLVNPVDTTASVKKINTYQASNLTERKIVPAQGWVFNEKGEVVLTSYDPQDINIQRVKQTSAICSGH